MLRFGQCFLVSWEIMGLEFRDEHCGAIVIPDGAILQVARFPCEYDFRMADVRWQNRKVLVFAADLIHRATAVAAESALAS
jgi:hypothetical protein